VLIKEVKTMMLLIGILMGGFFVGSVVMVVIGNREDKNELVCSGAARHQNTNNVIPVTKGVHTLSREGKGALRN
jgi:predicted permease